MGKPWIAKDHRSQTTRIQRIVAQHLIQLRKKQVQRLKQDPLMTLSLDELREVKLCSDMVHDSMGTSRKIRDELEDLLASMSEENLMRLSKLDTKTPKVLENFVRENAGEYSQGRV